MIPGLMSSAERVEKAVNVLLRIETDGRRLSQHRQSEALRGQTVPYHERGVARRRVDRDVDRHGKDVVGLHLVYVEYNIPRSPVL